MAPIKETLDDTKRRMDTSVEVVRKEMAAVRTGRASLAILDGVIVDYYGTPTPLNQIANLAVPEGNLITVQPWEPFLLPLIEKAILSSDLDLNPANDGKILRIPIPALTEERTEDFGQARGQDYRRRPHRRPASSAETPTTNSKSCSNRKRFPRTTKKRALKSVQELTDEHIKQAR